MNNKIVIIEDENSIRGFLKVTFQRNNFIVIEAETGEEGIRKARLEKPDLVLVDIMLPGIDGFKVCKTLREELPDIGIIILTAKGQDTDKIMGLEFGADDYVVKPFNPVELILRTKGLLRRIKKTPEDVNKRIIISGQFKLDVYSQKFYKNNYEIPLTPTEYLIMQLFIENPGKAFTRDGILNIVWGYNYVGDTKIVDVNIGRLRTKIEEVSSNPIYIETVWGKGYRWRDE